MRKQKRLSPSSKVKRQKSNKFFRNICRLVFYAPLTILVVRQLWSILAFSSLPESSVAQNSGGTTPLQKNSASSSAVPLSEIANTRNEGKPASCSEGFVHIQDIRTLQNEHENNNNNNNNNNKYNSDNKKMAGRENKIPKIVHQTSKSRCLTERMAEPVERWRKFSTTSSLSYYFHDDDAVMRLLREEFVEFPYLEPIVRKCLLHGTVKADLWRYIVLYVYGGIYSDIDTAPNDRHHLFDDRTELLFDSDAFFVVEQYHMLSQYFMAVSPRHPLMWYAIQESLSALLMSPDTGRVPAPMVTGPHALHRAFRSFCKDAGIAVDPAGKGYKPVRAGTYTGTRNRTVTVIGVGENQNEYIQRDVLRGLEKKAEYKKMGMTHFSDDKTSGTGRSCLSSILDFFYAEESKSNNKL